MCHEPEDISSCLEKGRLAGCFSSLPAQLGRRGKKLFADEERVLFAAGTHLLGCGIFVIFFFLLVLLFFSDLRKLTGNR